jgi:protein associated with RNAse G/E
MPIFVVQDTMDELILVLTPGTNGVVEENYPVGDKNGKRRWDFKEQDWKLAKFTWHTHRLLMILAPEKYYSTNLFWKQDQNKFVGYYINFQLPFTRSHCGIDTLDLELDIDIRPDFSFEWKDLDDYKKGIETGIISPEWVDEIEVAKIEILEKLEKRQYPFDGSWLNWMPDPSWSSPKLPENWDKI